MERYGEVKLALQNLSTKYEIEVDKFQNENH